MARAAMRDDIYALMIALTTSVVEHTDPGDPAGRVATWLDQGGAAGARALEEALGAIDAPAEAGLAPISVAVRRLRSLVR